MSNNFHIRFPDDDLAKFQKDLKEAPKELQRELYRRLNSVTKAFREHLKKSALSTLPGGLGARVAGASFTSRISRGKNFGVFIKVAERKGASFDPAKLDEGVNYHQTYGRGPFIKQAVEPGWFSKPWDEYGDDAIEAVGDVVDDVMRKLARG